MTASTHTLHAKVGGLHHKLFLDSPKRIHYGSDIPITGNVLLKHLPLLRGLPHSPLNAELFGPLQVDIILRGILRVFDIGPLGSMPEVFNLCTQRTTIYNKSFRAPADAEEKLPFSIKFPSTTNPVTRSAVAATQDAAGHWTFREHVQGVDTEQLPPTLEVVLKDHSWGNIGSTNLHTVNKVVIKIQYTVESQVRMPGIDVEIVDGNNRVATPVSYDQPKIPLAVAERDQSLTSDCSHIFTVQSESLRPEDEQPHGFRNKTRALLKPVDAPKYVFEANFIGIPRHAYVGQPISFAIAIAPDQRSTTKTDPDVFLDSCTVSLVAQTTGVQPAALEVLKTKEADFSSARPFSREQGLTKSIDVGTLTWVPTTFSFRDVERSYKLRIVGRFSVGSETVSTSRDVPLVVHPPIEVETPRAADALNDADGLPSYQESNRLDREDVPSYEQAVAPPMYQVEAARQ